ncbi:hypothetical protein BIY24_11435 [Halobacteriovorax marinus]|uniref:Uncharacterized protein n=1 Tax=Halobacteriovorax marinus (strain ATCC BAA-682 / DSM 15412 / SJ) TaxID=862908 RepID=E1X5B5_HALMS|nr:hypothetical protein [Halobacteriovorax marinus]ATH08540.1 hypothetical protein BIY24_11435 [Halobacteriovorax marinus]CBW27236.1 hypothetical protein BMS_2441 [Halobacteriovorax marinus SJ]
MALRLNDVTAKNKATKAKSMEVEEQRVLRPWEGFEKLGTQTRTIAAREAVKNARKKVQENNDLVDKLRDGFVELEKARDWDSYVDDKQLKLDQEIKELSSEMKKINTKPGVISFFKEMFKS